jgi:hypothetical protein
MTEDVRGTETEACQNVTSSTTNCTWSGLGSNLDIRCESPASNPLSHGTVCVLVDRCKLFGVPALNFFTVKEVVII